MAFFNIERSRVSTAQHLLHSKGMVAYNTIQYNIQSAVNDSALN